ncbi:hypothetical protein GII33_17640 [Gordonia pseudamarae]|uniref:Uncharacterized protein n=1 Tax=Gordonia pseudamarae TaxID=2831662 RepID=A0ABX6IKM0_9ACTN|nr:hypothetical protein [Gordonia pseudamarae]MBD0021140.1 hypothetical protein [Gordonia sp. (in: high G+C Gram-positive bacteria)]QHN27511.1 hypothetical protein GII33_17640 [Gordonia pseudamarae]QHN36394.1 hypothetical protein GII31_17415 [Gordonia pseudamarae]
MTVTKIHVLLGRQGIVVPYRTLIRFASDRCGYRRTTTVRIVDGDPGAEYQIDFGHLGMLDDGETGKRRKVFAVLIPDNMKPVVTQAYTLNPRLSRGW